VKPLESLLRDAGLSFTVDERDGVAILVPDLAAGLTPLEAADRARILQMARDAGFTHVALELDPGGAPLSRD
jgi:hypothetical protein